MTSRWPIWTKAHALCSWKATLNLLGASQFTQA